MADGEAHVESGAVEPIILPLDDKTLLLLIRTVLGCFYYSISRDGGSSWQAAKPTQIKSSNAPAGICSMADGRVVIVFNNCWGMAMTGNKYSFARQNLYAIVSDDHCRSFRGMRLFAKKTCDDHGITMGMAYPFLHPYDENSVYVSFFKYGSFEGDSWDDLGIQHVKMNLDFLYEEDVYADFVNGLGDWIADWKFSELVADAAGAIMLRIRNDDVSSGYAIYNFPFGRKGQIDLVMQANSSFNRGSILLSEYYLDRENFNEAPEDKLKREKYRESINHEIFAIQMQTAEKQADENNLLISIDQDRQIQLNITWDCEKKTAIVKQANRIKEYLLPNHFTGLNHLSVLLSPGSVQCLDIVSIHVHLDQPFFQSGIDY